MSGCPKCLSTNVDGGTEHGSTYDCVCRSCGHRFDCDFGTEETEEETIEAVAMNDSAPQKLPAAAQPQRESETMMLAGMACGCETNGELIKMCARHRDFWRKVLTEQESDEPSTALEALYEARIEKLEAENKALRESEQPEQALRGALIVAKSFMEHLESCVIERADGSQCSCGMVQARNSISAILRPPASKEQEHDT